MPVASSNLTKAYMRGVEAGQMGTDCANPYADHRNSRGGVTFARAYHMAWCRGLIAGTAMGPRRRKGILGEIDKLKENRK